MVLISLCAYVYVCVSLTGVKRACDYFVILEQPNPVGLDWNHHWNPKTSARPTCFFVASRRPNRNWGQSNRIIENGVDSSACEQRN